jgi:hypothetical protein
MPTKQLSTRESFGTAFPYLDQAVTRPSGSRQHFPNVNVPVLLGPQAAAASNPSRELAVRLAQVVEELQGAEAIRSRRDWLSAWFGTPSTSGTVVSFTAVPTEHGLEAASSAYEGTINKLGQESYRVFVLTSATASALLADESEPSKFLAASYALDKMNVRKALMATYRRLDGWLIEGRFDHCDEVLRRLDVSMMSEAGSIGVLTICAAARNRLTQYVGCAARVHQGLARSRSEAEVRTILRGLE